MRFDQLRFAPLRVCPIELSLAEACRSVVHIAETWLDLGILLPPPIPGIAPFLEFREMLGIRQGPA
jgi:hypothetical protein